ncbi:MAG: hypothetical protein ACR2G5_14840 [Pyrinomonadaceae bacterium]
MADEKNESSVKVENLPKPEKELTTEEAKAVKGGEVRRYDIVGAFPKKLEISSPTDIKAQD